MLGWDLIYSLVSSMVRLQPKKMPRSKQIGCPCINASKTSVPELCQYFSNSIKLALQEYPTENTKERWSNIRDIIYNTAMDTFGKREKQNPDWFEAGIVVTEPAIEQQPAPGL